MRIELWCASSSTSSSSSIGCVQCSKNNVDLFLGFFFNDVINVYNLLINLFLMRLIKIVNELVLHFI